ncbi:hypothetical protein MsAc7_11000 [Methanolapillus millepedarum]|uniref:DUF5640 domain-containing protein n=2 Tax=Methanolapillus millepedarum TaxID=3028296 RepID=A0AA96V5Q2_9EURY|nr:hypothetical protein MsAc7_11000 [Methanosarcinaceae archaeon Ac7]
MGDKIVGTWDGNKTKAVATFSSDKTFTISYYGATMNGTWAKGDGQYLLYVNNTEIGNAVFVDKDLRITLGSGLFSLTDDFVKRK